MSFTRIAIIVATMVLAATAPAQSLHDVVLQGGRVIDPETGLDGIRNVGIRGDRITAVSEAPLQGKTVIDVSGLVVSPGFIDLHAHGQSAQANLYQARDGVTTALELESGAPFVAHWLEERSKEAVLNYGVTVSHRGLRRAAMPEFSQAMERFEAAVKGEGSFQVGDYPGWEESIHKAPPSEELPKLIAKLEQGFREGALGVGMAHGYFPGASREEIYRVFQLAARLDAPIFTHIRGMGAEFNQEVFADAASTGAPLHIVHVNSTGLADLPLVLEMVAGLRQRGQDVTVESYPYTAASTNIASALFDPGWRDRLGMDYSDIQLQDTGERLNAMTFDKYRSEGAVVIMHMMKEEWISLAMKTPFVMIASDGMPYAPGAHPRSAGTFSRVLGRYVRDLGLIPLSQAIERMTLMPAKRLETVTGQAKRKGRIQVGADADITVFDPETVRDTATFEDDLSFSEGVAHVMVNGVFVVRGGENVSGARPGRALTGKYLAN